MRKTVIDDPVAYVLSANLHRRQLTASQKAIAIGKADELIERLQKEAKKRQKEHGGTAPGKKKNTSDKIIGSEGDTRDKLGKLADISPSMVDRGRKVVQKGIPELGKAVEEGRMSVTTAAELAEEDEETQREAAPNTPLLWRYKTSPKTI